MSEPTTEAGRDLLRYTKGLPDLFQTPTWLEGIIAIEAEAYEKALREAAERAVTAVHESWVGEHAHHCDRVMNAVERAILASGEGPAEADPPASAPGPLDPAAVLNHAISASIATTPPKKKRKHRVDYSVVNYDEGDEAPD